MNINFKACCQLLCVVFLLIGCATPQGAWKQAQQKNTRHYYDDFINRYPNSEFAPKAKEKIAELDWAEARKIDSIREYGAYLKKHPYSTFSNNAHNRIAELRYSEIISSGRYGPLERFINSNKKPELSAKAKNYAIETFNIHQTNDNREVIWQPTKPPRKDEIKVLLEIEGTLYNEEKLSNLSLISDYHSGSTKSAWTREFLLAQDLIALKELKSQIQHDLSDGFHIWCIIPKKAGDYIRHTGEVVLRGKQKNITITEFEQTKRNTDNFDAFNRKIDSEDFIIYQDIIPIIYINRSRSLNGFSEIIKSAYIYKNVKKFETKSHTVIPCNVLILGNVRLPDDQWITIKDGVEAKGGGMLFREDGIFFSAGTKVAFRIEKN